MSPLRRFLLLLAAAACVTVGLRWAWDFYHDDAYITLRYIARLLEGRGLTWSGTERVEGFTHPLWLFQLAGLGALGIDLEAASRWLGIAYLAALAAWWVAAGLWGPALLVVLCHPGVLYWTVSGLETTSFCFWAALCVWGTGRLARRKDSRPAPGLALGLAFTACTLTRPEGLGVSVVMVLWLAVSRSGRRALACVLPAFLVPCLAYLGFRLAYFGALLPNTALVKVAGISAAEGLQLAGRYLWLERELWQPLAVGAAVVALLRIASPLWLGVLGSLPLFASIVLAGGDHMRYLRLAVPAFVLLLVGLGLAGPLLPRKRRLAAGLLLAGVVGWQGWILLAHRHRIERDPAAAVGTPVGRFLDQHLATDSLVALATAGSTPYFAPDLRFLDTLGLNDRHIARVPVPETSTRGQRLPGHRKGDGAYVLQRRPDVIILGGAEGDRGEQPRRLFLTCFQLVQSVEFRQSYRPYRFLIPVDPGNATPHLRRRLQEGDPPAFEFIAYLRTDSPAAAALGMQGQPVTPPWENPEAAAPIGR